MALTSNDAVIVPPRSAASATTNDIRAIKPPVEIPSGWLWAAWVGAALLLVSAAVVGVIWWRRRSTRAVPVVIVPPHVRAKNRLREALALITDPRAFCIAVSSALRVYLEERFNFRAPERTTEEFLLDLQATTLLSTEQKLSLANFLQECDLVKFARVEPNENELRRLHDAALRLVDETQFDKIAPTITEPAAASAQPSEPVVSHAE
jgi:hypothetical protein